MKNNFHQFFVRSWGKACILLFMIVIVVLPHHLIVLPVFPCLSNDLSSHATKRYSGNDLCNTEDQFMQPCSWMQTVAFMTGTWSPGYKRSKFTMEPRLDLTEVRYFDPLSFCDSVYAFFPFSFLTEVRLFISKHNDMYFLQDENGFGHHSACNFGKIISFINHFLICPA